MGSAVNGLALTFIRSVPLFTGVGFPLVNAPADQYDMSQFALTLTATHSGMCNYGKI